MSLINQYEKKIMFFNNMKDVSNQKTDFKYCINEKNTDNKRYKNNSLTNKFVKESNLINEELEYNNIRNDHYKLEYLSNMGEIIIEQFDNNIQDKYKEDQEINICITTNNISDSSESVKENQTVKYSDNIMDYFNNSNKVENKTKKKIDKYNFVINNEKIKKEEDKCPNCHNKINQIIVDNKLVCQFCGFSKNETLFCSPENNEINKKVFYPYKRLNHLKECLNQLRAKETITIPQNVKDLIVKELLKKKIKLEDTKYEDVNNVVKFLKLNKYYDHYIYITVLITGKQPLTLKKQEEKDIIIMFQNILTAYETIDVKKRVNFLNYYYVLHKIFEIKNNLDFMKYCPLLKSTDKLIQQDMIWKQICKKLNWKYIPSI